MTPTSTKIKRIALVNSGAILFFAVKCYFLVVLSLEYRRLLLPDMQVNQMLKEIFYDNNRMYVAVIENGAFIIVYENGTALDLGITRVYEKNDCKNEHIKIIARYFPPHPPLNVIFKDGIFNIDFSKDKSINTKDDLFRKSKTAKEQKSEKLIEAYKNIKSDDGTAKISDLANVLDISVNTVKKHISSTPGFKKVKDGYVRLCTSYTVPIQLIVQFMTELHLQKRPVQDMNV